MDQVRFAINAAAPYTEVERNGPPENPRSFDHLGEIPRAHRQTIDIYDPTEHTVLSNKRVVFPTATPENPRDTAYWIRNTIGDCQYGKVKYCVVLKQSPHQFTLTEHKAACKIMSLEMIQKRTTNVEDPIQEVVAMMHCSQRAENNEARTSAIIPVLDVFHDTEYLYVFMPFCADGNLYQVVENTLQRQQSLTEVQARYWFKQVLECLSQLQSRGICHRDISFDNFVVHRRQAVVIDLGMSLYVPYRSNEDGSVVDVHNGLMRILMKPIVACGKLRFMSPEIVLSKTPFDGYYIDLWAAGVMLFRMLTGNYPWELANGLDRRYKKMVQQRQLVAVLQSMRQRRANLQISDDAIDLLRGMLQEDPRDRLTFQQVMDHPFLNRTESVEDENQEGRRMARTSRSEGWRF